MTLRLSYGIVKALTCREWVIDSFLKKSELSEKTSYFSDMKGKLTMKGVLIQEIRFKPSETADIFCDEFVCLDDIRKRQANILRENNMI